MPERLRTLKCLILFLVVLAFQQITVFLVNINVIPGWFQAYAYLPTQILFILIFVLFVKSDGSTFHEHGLSLPDGTDTYFTIAVFTAALYVLITIFLPGSLEGFEAFPATQLSSSFFITVAGILAATSATEIVFRGYIQTNLTQDYGFWPALLTNSIMSTVYMFSLPIYAEFNLTAFYYSGLTFFAESIFLSTFFQKTKTLVPVVTYSAGVSLLYKFTPLKPVPAEYTPLILFTVYVLLTPIMLLLVANRTQKTRYGLDQDRNNVVLTDSDFQTTRMSMVVRKGVRPIDNDSN